MIYKWQECPHAGTMMPGYCHLEVPDQTIRRAPLPAGVFAFPAIDSWREPIWSMLGDFVTDDVKDAFLQNRPEYIVSDDLSWLDGIIAEVTGEWIDSKSALACRMSEGFRSFRAFHGTRTNDLSQFYTHGLRYLRADEAEEIARQIFFDGPLTRANQLKMQAAVQEIDARSPQGGREGRLYFCANEESLTHRLGGAGHYLIYGGEYLFCLGTRLVGAHEAKRRLKSAGRPTMFVCDIPVAIMREATLFEFAGSVIEALFCELVGEDAGCSRPEAGTALSLTVDLSAEHIVGHCHPSSIYDPFWNR